MDFTLSNAPEYVIDNINRLKKIWLERCELIEKKSKSIL